MAEEIRERDKITKKVFKTDSDVHRAAHCLGMTLLWYIKTSSYQDSLHSMFVENDLRVLNDATLIDNFLDSVKVLINFFDKSLIDAETLNSKIETLINLAPERLRNFLQSRCQELKNRKSISNLYETAHWGGNRK